MNDDPQSAYECACWRWLWAQKPPCSIYIYTDVDGQKRARVWIGERTWSGKTPSAAIEAARRDSHEWT